MKKMSREQSVLIIFAILILIITGGFLFLEKGNNTDLISNLSLSSQGIVKEGVSNQEYTTNGQVRVDNENEEIEKKIFVHVAGEVNRSGVYELSEGSRVIDALQAAGGATSLAELDMINLAAPISDGQQIYIPSVIVIFNQSNTEASIENYSGNSSGRININTADSSELQKLSGIGPSKADSIINYRNDHGLFSSVDELLEVSGIGAKTLEKIRDEISIR